MDGLPLAVADRGTAAGFWIRLVAWIIDNIIVFAFGAAIWPLLFGETFWVVTRWDNENGSSGVNYTTRDWHTLMWFCYIVFFHAMWGGTLGKMALNIRVVNENGSHRLGFPRALLRAVGSYISAILLLSGYIMIAFRKDKRGLHDLIANTYAIVRVPRTSNSIETRDPWRPASG